MKDPNTDPADEFYTVKLMAQLTGRSPAIIRRYIRNGTVASIQDPTDRRQRLIPWIEAAKIARQPRRGHRRVTTSATMSDGTTIRLVATRPTERRELPRT